jgi:hypothetical protein
MLGEKPLEQVKSSFCLRITPRAPATADTSCRWLGAQQRPTNTLGGLTLMGLRLYNPTTGRFLTTEPTDPIAGGNPNSHVFPTDPINNDDLTTQPGRPGPLGFTCQACGTVVVTAVDELFTNPPRGSRQRFCSPACRQAAYRRRHAHVDEDAPRQHTGDRTRGLAKDPK